MTATSMTTEREDERQKFEDRVAHAINSRLCEMIDAKEPMDTLRVTASVVALPEIQGLIDRALPPQPTGDAEGLEPLGINLVAVAHKERKNGNPELAAIIERAAAVIDQLRRANSRIAELHEAAKGQLIVVNAANARAEAAERDKESLRMSHEAIASQCATAEARVAKLEMAMRDTIENNLHLADGEVCTLIRLKRALSTGAGEEKR